MDCNVYLGRICAYGCGALLRKCGLCRFFCSLRAVDVCVRIVRGSVWLRRLCVLLCIVLRTSRLGLGPVDGHANCCHRPSLINAINAPPFKKSRSFNVLPAITLGAVHPDIFRLPAVETESRGHMRCMAKRITCIAPQHACERANHRPGAVALHIGVAWTGACRRSQ